MRTVYVKNLLNEEKDWGTGHLYSPLEEFLLDTDSRIKSHQRDSFIAAINANEAQIGDGTVYFTTVTSQISCLLGLNEQVSVKELAPQGNLNRPEIAVHKPEGNSYALASHDFCDKCSWFSDSVRVEGETLTLDTGKTYNSANTYWIDLSHGRFYQEDLVSSPYLPKIYDDGVELTEGSDYTIEYETGKVTFDAGYTITGAITADYSYATTSTFYIFPSSTVTKFVEHTELQVSKNVNILDTIDFEVWVYNPYDLPNKFLYEKISYKNAKDYINGCNLGQGYIPSFGGTAHGIAEDVVVFPFNYASMTPLSAATGAEVRVKLKNDIPIGSTNSNPSWGTVTFYVLEKEV